MIVGAYASMCEYVRSVYGPDCARECVIVVCGGECMCEAIYMWTCIYICVCMCACVYACVRIVVYTCMCVLCVTVCVYGCMHVCIHVMYWVECA